MLTGAPLLIAVLAALLFIVIACSKLRWHPFLVLTATALLLGLVVGLPPLKVVTTAIEGAGAVFTGIGLIIALGTILGTILEKTAAAQSIATMIVKKTGKKSATGGMSLLGAITGIPVFCDSGFVILSNLSKSLSKQTGLSSAAMSIALATGLYSTHVLVPPTPGPLAAAGNLGMAADLGWVILVGLATSIPAVVVGYFFARGLGKRDKEISFEMPQHEPAIIGKYPRLSLSLIPLLMPVVLIASGSLLNLFNLSSKVESALLFICNPNIALLLSVITGFVILGKQNENVTGRATGEREKGRNITAKWNEWIQESLAQAGPIILITTAGGALGAVLKATPLADDFSTLLSGRTMSPMIILPAAYLLAAGLKTSQGSSTAALVISSSIIAPLLDGWPFDGAMEKALLVTSLGAGAMTVSHANDSYFWVINQYGNVSVPRMYRYFTLATLCMGIAVLLSCMALTLLF